MRIRKLMISKLYNSGSSGLFLTIALRESLESQVAAMETQMTSMQTDFESRIAALESA